MEVDLNIVELVTCMVNGAYFNNLTFFIVRSFTNYGGYHEIYIPNKLVRFGANGIIVFQGLKFGVTIRLMQNDVLFVTGVHYMTHHTNLGVQTLSGLNLVKMIESMFFSIYIYFVHNLKCCLEVNKLVKLPKCKGNKFLKNIKTQWILMFSPSK